MNISEFAQKAGVSKSAVSRYFNKGYLSEDKRELIERAIEETGYAPSISAQNVRTKVTKLIGVILPKLSSESCARITEGIGEILNKKGKVTRYEYDFGYFNAGKTHFTGHKEYLYVCEVN